MKFFTLILAFLLTIGQLLAYEPDSDISGNKTTISGRVVDEKSLPLPGAAVFIESIRKGVVTDVNGFYRIGNLEPKLYEVNVSYIGFKPEVKKIETQAGKASMLDFSLKAGLDISEVIVNGTLQGQSKAINLQKNSINITNIISSDQVTRFPDSNIGDALKRIPGINVQYDQGEARFGHIRGTSPDMNTVTINGDRIPSAEAETRSIQLDLIPSDMIQAVEVNKVVTPDMSADAIGGSINLVTRNSPYKRRISGTIGTGYNILRNKPAGMFSLVYGDRFLGNKLGMVLAGSYHNNILGSDDIEALWTDNGKVYAEEFEVRTYLIQRLRQSYSASFDYTFNPNHKVEFKGIYNHRNDWENRYRITYKGIAEKSGAWTTEIRRQTKGASDDQKSARLEDQRTYNFAINGEHHFGSLKFSWKGSLAKASEDRPNERYITYNIKKVSVTPNLTDTKNPYYIVNTDAAKAIGTVWGLKELTEEFQYTDDKDKNLKFDLSLPISKDKNPNKISFGMYYRGKEKQRDNSFNELSPVDEDAFNAMSYANLTDKSKENFLAGEYQAGKYIENKYLGSLDLDNGSQYEKERLPEEEAGNFTASENIVASYLSFEQKFGDKTELLAGVRMENTSLEYQGNQLLINEDGDVTLTKTAVKEDDYMNILPSLIVKYSFTDQSKLKFAWTNTIARPKYYDLVPHVELNLEDMEANIGNPALEATRSMNFDLMFENYFKSIGQFSAGVFLKDINEFIVKQQLRNYTYNGNVYTLFSQPINAGDATLLGFEVSFQRQFDFLGGFWKQFGVYANYTYTKSDVKNFNVEGRENEELSLPGSPKNTLNASLFYEGRKLSVRASFNFADAFIDEVGSTSFYDRYYDKVTYLDVNANYMIGKKLNVFAEANNLLNQPLRYYQGVSERTMQAEYYNTTLRFGVKFDL